MTIDQQRDARQLLLQETFGVLSTMSVDVPGYPFGSVTPYCVDQNCQPILYISMIAQHTKNIMANRKVSLTIVETNHEPNRPHDVQAHGRLTLLADAKPVDRNDDAARDRYLRYFPSAVPYDQTHDFVFFRLDLVRARFIGGFGQIFWLTREELSLTNAFSTRDQAHIIQRFIQSTDEAPGFQIIGLDSEGVDIVDQGLRQRLSFEKPVHTIEDAQLMLGHTFNVNVH